MAMEELDEFEVLWPETSCHSRAHGPPTSSSPVPVQVQPSEAPAAARSRPVDVPNPRVARVSCRWNDDVDRLRVLALDPRVHCAHNITEVANCITDLQNPCCLPFAKRPRACICTSICTHGQYGN
ncbi:hypothetical protein SETIT_3G168400v2 [Setaria italica]|uniref:Uncharacterized protein n=3 Tax=Setaria TaxID=4554 RepID=A0A368QFQ4_SETIT|nr:hypothetical protein SETIT_3G168400v2 [Setaria italica]TKW26218.1 hypothetical protein SEVIR_3G172600v2 [Setaria viridis]